MQPKVAGFKKGMVISMGKRTSLLFLICMFIVLIGLTGCDKRQSASLNNRIKADTSVTKKAVKQEPDASPSIAPEDVASAGDADTAADDPEYQAFMDSKASDNPQTQDDSDSTQPKDFGPPDTTGRVGYHYDIEKDKKDFGGKADIVVGDKLYATQINDWYTNFDQYEGKTVEIEGYYINDYAPYTFVGRYGPSCPYCNGGYVSFEFYTQDDLTLLKSVEDWIKVTGILRQGEDSSGVFYYIEALSIQKMDKVGKDTVSN